jgi:hypothetical protein
VSDVGLSNFDLAFPVIPVEDDPSPPEDSGMVLIDDLADFAEDELTDEDAAETSATQWGRDVAYDWGTDELYSDLAGRFEEVTGQDAYIEAVQKALYTPRGEFAVHNAGYGSDLDRIIQGQLPSEVTFAEIHRTVRECCLFFAFVRDAEVIAITPAPTMTTGTYLVSVDLVFTTSPISVQLDLAV